MNVEFIYVIIYIVITSFLFTFLPLVDVVKDIYPRLSSVSRMLISPLISDDVKEAECKLVAKFMLKKLVLLLLLMSVILIVPSVIIWLISFYISINWDVFYASIISIQSLAIMLVFSVVFFKLKKLIH